MPGLRDQGIVQHRQRGQVPGVRFGHCGRPALAGEDLERRETDPVQAGHRPAVPCVRLPEPSGVVCADAEAGQQVADVQPTRCGPLQRRDGVRQACGGRGAHRRVLVADQFLRLRRPRQQFAVQGEPIRAEVVQERSAGVAESGDQCAHGGGVVEERSAGAGVDHAGAAVADPEPLRGDRGVAGQHRRSPGNPCASPRTRPR